MNLEAQIEAILFWKGEPSSSKELSKFLNVETTEVEVALRNLEISLQSRGLCLTRNGSEVMLYTAPEASELIKKLVKEESTRDISKAAVEVLSLVLYRGPISKREVDYIRGVNSSYIIRNLLVRGLVERVEAKDKGSFVYQTTFDLLSHLGITKKEDLPDFDSVQKDITEFTANAESAKENHGD